MAVKIFIAYSHHDKVYLGEGSLLGHLRGLEQDGGSEFWYDERITTGDLWDDEIRQKISECQIALLLVSELFLTSNYVRNVEIPSFLNKRKEAGMILFPIILSECDWKSHDWLAATQFLPKDGKNIESHYRDLGSQKELFLQAKRDLKRQIARIAKPAVTPTTSPIATLAKPLAPVKTSKEALAKDWENPFELVTATDIRYEDIPQLFVGDYTDFNTIKKHFDTVLEGQRGTGKTMVLRFMALETQIKVWTEQKKRLAADFLKDQRNFVGVYCRLDQGVFDRSDLDAVGSNERKDRLFEHRISLFCLSHCLKTVSFIFTCVQGNESALDRIKRRLSSILNEPKINECNGWFETYAFAQDTIDVRVTEEDLHLSSLLPGGTPTEFNPWMSLSGQIVPWFQLLQETLAISCPFFLMLDDFDVLRPSQQLAVFRTASARKLGTVCFKYGIMTLGKKVILSGTDRTYRAGHDYDPLILDWTDKGLQTDYKRAIDAITERRLKAKGWPEGVTFDGILAEWKRGKELREEVKRLMQSDWSRLPKDKRPKTFENFWSKYGNARYFQFLAKKKIHHRYSGYETAIDVSSGIFRQYLEPSSKIVASALGSGWRPTSGKPISAEIQDEAIRSYSQAMMDNLSVTAGDTTSLLLGDIQITSRHMVTFIESLSQLFNNRLHSNIREPEIFCLAIRNGIDSNPTAKAILDVALRESILHRRAADYTPKSAGGPPLPTFMLNRRLAPRRGIGLRMQGRIEVVAEDIVLAAEDTDAFVKKFLKADQGTGQMDFGERM
jgi:hypothetical protein